MEPLTQVVGWILTVFTAALCAIVVAFIIIGKINISKLISEPNGDASLSRFQFLIFTFVIALSLFLVTVGQNPARLPEIPAGVFALLGISAGSYVVSKGIQTARDTRMQEISAPSKASQSTLDVHVAADTPADANGLATRIAVPN